MTDSMETQAEYYDRAKQAIGAKSDRDFARKIGISPTYLNRFKKGNLQLSEHVMLDLATRANLDPDEALILLNFWRSHGEAKSRYARLLHVFKSGALVFAACFFTFSPPRAEAANSLNNNVFPCSEFLNTIHYA